MQVEIRDGFLIINDEPILEGVSGEAWSAEADPAGRAVFLSALTKSPTPFLRSPLGKVLAAHRYTVLSRYEPFWCAPYMVPTVAEIPTETQFVLADLFGDGYVLIVPVFGETRRTSLRGTATGIEAVGESNDPYTSGGNELAVVVAVGHDPYALIAQTAAAVADRIPSARLREAKPLPDFVDQFGWCTWDAFYQEVDADKVRAGLESFRVGGISPQLLILDDGWQSESPAECGGHRLTSFAPNAKFGGDLTSTVRLAKDEFGVKTFLVWHAFHGYWAGVDERAFPQYDVRVMARHYGPPLQSPAPNYDWEWWGNLAGVVPPAKIGDFYDDYHRTLRAQGVDGVKVDNQAMTESLVTGLGGRVAVTRAYRQGLESSVRKHFAGRLINCMSNANEMHLMATDSTITRTSTDFWPNIPSSHGAHLQCNAQMGMWFGQFIHPDWDMFQSGHEWGAYHAAGRAISASPIYVSDKLDGHDFEVLRRLVLSDGTVCRTDAPALPTPDCLFVDCTKVPVPLKIYSTVGDVGILGAFHAVYGEDGDVPFATGDIGPSDVVGLTGTQFAGWSYGGGLLGTYARNERIGLSLGPGEWEVFAFAPIIEGFAPIGLIDKLNAPGTIRSILLEGDAWVLNLRDGGAFLAYADRAPTKVIVDGIEVKFDYSAEENKLTLVIPVTGGAHELRIVR